MATLRPDVAIFLVRGGNFNPLLKIIFQPQKKEIGKSETFYALVSGKTTAEEVYEFIKKIPFKEQKEQDSSIKGLCKVNYYSESRRVLSLTRIE